MTSFIVSAKQKLIVIGLALIALAPLSCKKALDPKPKDIILDEDFLRDYWDADFMLRGAY